MVIEKETQIQCLKKCPVDVALGHINKKWTINILKNILLGSKHFNEILKECEGLSTKVLSQRLKELEEDKLITKNIRSTTPLVIEYELTTKGRSLNKVMYELAMFVVEHYRKETFVGNEKQLQEAKDFLKKEFLG